MTKELVDVGVYEALKRIMDTRKMKSVADAEIKDLMAKAKEDYERYSEELGTKLVFRSVENSDPDIELNLVSTTRTTLNKEALLDAGVSLEIMAACMKESTSTQVRVRYV